jgi:Flp pilus assembly protein TadD
MVGDIDELWDYDEPAASETRFREALANETSPERVHELMTQLARAVGLQRRFEDAHSILDEVTPATPRVEVRHLLERGRVLNSSGKPDEAKPLFVDSFELAQANGMEFLAADAAHMVAIVTSGAEAIAWNQKTLDIAEVAEDERARKWTQSIRNNMGWAYYDLGEFENSLQQFEIAEELSRGGPVKRHLIARWCVAKAKRALGRYEEALAEQLNLEIANKEIQSDDAFVQEELGECLLALRRTEEARRHFVQAYEKLSKIAWVAEDQPDRMSRIKDLAGLS